MERRDAGFALVAVLWVTALLGLLAAGIGSSSRTEIRLAYNAVDRAKARALADGGVHRALYELSTDFGGLIWRRGAVDYRQSVGGGEVAVRIRDEDGKLDVNAISLELWRRLLIAVGVDPDRARALAERIGDYRDDDHDALPLGAEDPDYAAAGLTQGAADRPFLTTSELLNVLGMTGEVYERLRPHVTVHADVEGVDPTRASALALQALPGMTPEAAEAIVASQAGDDPLDGVSDDLLAEADDYLLPSRELVFSIQSEGVSERGGRFVREAIVALDGGGRQQLYTVYAWRRGQPFSASP